MLQNASYMFFFFKKKQNKAKLLRKKRKKSQCTGVEPETLDVKRVDVLRATHYALRHATKLLRPLVKLIIFIIFVPAR